MGYFVTPIVNSVDPDSELGAAMFEPARKQIIDADEQYTRLDWEYEGGELAVDTDEKFLKPSATGQQLSKAQALREYGVPPEAIDSTAPHHRERLFHGINVNTGITDSAPFYQVFSPAAGRQLPVRSEPVSAQCGKPRGPELRCAVSGGRRGKDRHRDRQQQAEAVLHGLRPSGSTGGRSARPDRCAGLLADHIPGAPGKGKLNISFKWDDSIILDRLSEMAQWQQEVSMGLRSKTEYRMHFFGEDEETATRAVQAIQQETGASDILKGVIDNGDG